MDFVVETERGHLAVAVKSKPSSDAVWTAIGRWQYDPVADAAPIMVAEWFPVSALDALNRAGWSWYDRRRGHLRLDLPDAGIDADYHVPATERSVTAPAMKRDPLASPVGKELVVELLLLDADQPRAGSFRDLARTLGRSVSSVHGVMVALKEDGLVTDDGMPLRAELFESLARAWRPRVVDLADAPRPGAVSALANVAGLNLFDNTRPGWALTDTRAASAWGAPVVASGEYPPDFYVPSRRALRWAVQQYGTPPTHDQRAATVAVAPVAAVCARRYDPGALRERAYEQFPLAHPLFVALDLARDPARGREVLEAWDPHGPDGFQRAW